MRIHKQSRPRYKSRLNSDRESATSFVLLFCSSSLSEPEPISLRSKRSLILFLVLIACSLVSLSLTCNKVSLHFRVVRPGMWQRQLTRQDTRPKNYSHAHKQRSRERQLWDNLFCWVMREEARQKIQLTQDHSWMLKRIWTEFNQLLSSSLDSIGMRPDSCHILRQRIFYPDYNWLNKHLIIFIIF